MCPLHTPFYVHCRIPSSKLGNIGFLKYLKKSCLGTYGTMWSLFASNPEIQRMMLKGHWGLPNNTIQMLVKKNFLKFNLKLGSQLWECLFCSKSYARRRYKKKRWQAKKNYVELPFHPKVWKPSIPPLWIIKYLYIDRVRLNHQT